MNYTHTHDANGDRLYLFAYLFKYALNISGAKTVTLPNDSDIIVMAATASECGNAAAAPLVPLYDKVENQDQPKYKLTVEGAEGSGMYPAGKKVLIHTARYTNRVMLTGWRGDCILEKYNSAAVVCMPDHDLTVGTVTEQIESDSVLLTKPYKVSTIANRREIGACALNGKDEGKWCTACDSGIHWLEVDAEEVVKVGKWFVMHSGIHESPTWNTRSFKLEYKVNESDEWKTADALTDNSASMTYRSFEPVEGRYFRLYIDQSTQNPKDTTTRIYMFEVYKA